MVQMWATYSKPTQLPSEKAIATHTVSHPLKSTLQKQYDDQLKALPNSHMLFIVRRYTADSKKAWDCKYMGIQMPGIANTLGSPGK